MIKTLGSIQFALVLIASFALVLIISTFTESIHGTPFAQQTFYRARWFDLFLALVGVNVLCSALSRIPYKKHHTGFVITHTGILMLLIGSLMSRLLGVEGQMALLEGEGSNRISQEGHVLGLVTPDDKQYTVAFRAKRLKKPETRELSGTPLAITIHEILPFAARELVVTEGEKTDPPNRALKIHLSSATANFDQTFWLIEKDTENPAAHFVDLGPARIELETAKGGGRGPHLRIRRKRTRETFLLPLDPETKSLPLGDGELTLTGIRYYPNARVIDNKIIEISSDEPLNPAVEFEIVDSKDRRERHTRFAIFPDFESLHGAAGEDFFGLETRLIVPSLEDAGSAGAGSSPVLAFTQDAEGPWFYESRASRGIVSKGEAVVGKKFETGWMDFVFSIEDKMAHAVPSRRIKPLGENQKGSLAVALAVSEKHEKKNNPGQHDPPEKTWVFENEPRTIPSSAGPIHAIVTPQSRAVPFQLTLKDFRKIDYPGTQNPASFESDVVLRDPPRNFTLEATIQMNHPLDYKGFRVFQSSYLQDPFFGEVSVFTIAKNPGITLIYTGAAVIFAGVIVLFYVRPFTREYARNG